MFYERGEVSSFEVETGKNEHGVVDLLVDILGLGKRSKIGSVWVGSESNKSHIVWRQELVEEDPYCMQHTNPDFEVAAVGRNRLWVGFHERYDQEIIEIARSELLERLHTP